MNDTICHLILTASTLEKAKDITADAIDGVLLAYIEGGATAENAMESIICYRSHLELRANGVMTITVLG